VAAAPCEGCTLWERRPRRDQCRDGRCAKCVSRRGRRSHRTAPTKPPLPQPAQPAVLPTPVPPPPPISACNDATLHKFSDAPPHFADRLYTLRGTHGCSCSRASCNKPTLAGDFMHLRIILESLSHKRFPVTGSFFMSRSDYEIEALLQRFCHLHSLTSRAGQRTEFFTADSPNGSFIGTTHFGRV